MSAAPTPAARASARSPREMLLYAVIKAVSGLAGLLAAIVVTRTLGPEYYGFYSTSWFLILTCSSLGFSWLNQCVLRFGPDSLRVPGLLGALVWSGAITALAAIGGACLAFHGLAGRASAAFLALAGAAICLGLTALSQAVFQSRIQPSRILWTELVKFSLLLILPTLLAWHWRGEFSLALGILLAAAVALVVAFPPLRQLLSPSASEKTEASTGSFRGYFSYGFSLTLFSAGLTGLPVLERYFLLMFFDPARAGQYIGVYDLVVRGFTVGLMPVTLALHPRIMNAFNAGDLARSNRLIRTGLLAQVGLAALGALTVLACSPILFRLLKIEQPFSWPLLLALCGSGAGWQIALMVQKPLERGNKTQTVLLSFAASLTLIVVLDSVLPKIYGLAGIAIANLSGACAYLLLVGSLGFLLDRARARTLNPEPA